MTDEKNYPETPPAHSVLPPLRPLPRVVETEMVRANEPVSGLESVSHRSRDADSGDPALAGMDDSFRMASVFLGSLVTLVILAAASTTGLSAFVGGILVGTVAGILFWSYNH